MLTKNEDLVISILLQETITLSARDIYKQFLLKFDKDISLSGLYIILRKLQDLKYITSITGKGNKNKSQNLFKSSKKGREAFLESYKLSQKTFANTWRITSSK